MPPKPMKPPTQKEIKIKLFKTVTKNGKTYKVNKTGTTICPNCLGVDGCMCALKNPTPQPHTDWQRELETKDFVENVQNVLDLNAIDSAKIMVWHLVRVDQLLTTERTKLLAELESWLVDEHPTTIQIISRNELKAELRAKVQEMKGGK